jgi:hypothetical protein
LTGLDEVSAFSGKCGVVIREARSSGKRSWIAAVMPLDRCACGNSATDESGQ